MRNLHIAVDRILFSLIHSIWPIFILLVLFFSCKQNENIQQEHLFGRWEITKAERNGKETSYLRRGYFIIGPDGNMTINITGEDEKGPYTMENNRLVMGEKKFELKELTPDSMIVSYIKSPSSHFIFYLLKKQDNVQ